MSDKQIIIGDMLSVFDEVDHFIICVSRAIKAETGELIMLNGMAGKLAAKYPTLPLKMGQWITENHEEHGAFWFRCTGKVGILQHMVWPKHGISLAIISQAVKRLAEQARENSQKRYALEYPGYTSPTFLVQGILNLLPDNVEVWKEKA